MKKLCEKEKQEVLEDLGHLLRPTFEFTQLSKETGEIDGYKYMIRPSGVCTCAYIKIPKGHPWYTEDEEFHPSNGPEIPVNGGCTFYEYFPEDKAVQEGVDALVEILKQEFGKDVKYEVIDINPTIGSHCGPNAMGLCFHSTRR